MKKIFWGMAAALMLTACNREQTAGGSSQR